MQTSLDTQQHARGIGQWHMIAWALALLAIPLIARDCVAQMSTGEAATEESVEPEISREGWRARVEEARGRAKEAALERRNHPEIYAVIPDDPEKIATERVLNDESLQRGDIVSTNKGLFVFRGRSDQPRRTYDFIPLPPR